METLSLLWEFAPSFKFKLLLLALVAQMALTVYCYSAMSKARMSAAKAKRIEPDVYKATHNEPEDLRVFSRLVANQFEMPVMFYALVLATVAAATASWLTVILAWVYVVMRIIHAREMMTQNRVLLRRRLFIKSTQVFLLMLAEFTLALLFLASF